MVFFYIFRNFLIPLCIKYFWKNRLIILIQIRYRSINLFVK